MNDKGKNFKVDYSEMSSTEMVLTFFTMLESRGYPGFNELLAVLGDPTVILKMMRLMYGMTIKIPPLDEIVKCLRASMYTFCDMHKKIHKNLPVKPLDIRKFMDISQEEEKELLQMFDDWAIYMNKNGHDIRNYFHINRGNTKKRIDMVTKGKKWTRTKY